MLTAGVTVRQFLDTCMPIMAEVGDRFEKGGYYLPHLVMAGEMFKTAVRKIKSSVRAGEAGPAIAGIVLGTPMGDIHDLGKDIFGVLAEASGFAVYNLGVDVPPEAFISRLEETGTAFPGLSFLLTTTFGTIEQIVALLDVQLRDDDARAAARYRAGRRRHGQDRRNSVHGAGGLRPGH